MRVADFVSVMREWRAFFTADKPVVGATEEELRRIKVPTTIIAGGDDIHPRHVAEKLHALLPQSEFHPPFWMPEERERLAPGTPEYREAMAERVGPILLEFLDRHHARAGA
jgi:pimeloyl-ACP methyl ester carboxylesterase